MSGGDQGLARVYREQREALQAVRSGGAVGAALGPGGRKSKETTTRPKAGTTSPGEKYEVNSEE